MNAFVSSTLCSSILALTYPFETLMSGKLAWSCFLQWRRDLLPKRLLFSKEGQKERKTENELHFPQML